MRSGWLWLLGSAYWLGFGVYYAVTTGKGGGVAASGVRRFITWRRALGIAYLVFGVLFLLAALQRFSTQ